MELHSPSFLVARLEHSSYHNSTCQGYLEAKDGRKQQNPVWDFFE